MLKAETDCPEPSKTKEKKCLRFLFGSTELPYSAVYSPPSLEAWDFSGLLKNSKITDTKPSHFK
jgi:hypothetical protein